MILYSVVVFVIEFNTDNFVSDEIYQWRVQNKFWETDHDFKPHFAPSMTRQYTRAAIFLNGNPFVMILFFRLCSFLLATAIDFQRFNITFSAIYSSLIVWIIALLMMKRRPDSAIRYKTILKWTSIYSGLCTIVINLHFIFTFV